MAGIEFSNGKFMTIRGGRNADRVKGTAADHIHQSGLHDSDGLDQLPKSVESAAGTLRGIALDLSRPATEDRLSNPTPPFDEATAARINTVPSFG